MSNRRHLLYLGAAAAAGMAGAGVAWLRSGSNEAHPAHSGAPGEGGGAKTPATSKEEGGAGFWSQTYETPDGVPLPMSRFAGKLLLVNFWATWCPPCIEELPLLDSFFSRQRPKGWEVLGLAVDQPSAVRAWLKKSPLGFPVAMAGLSGTQLSKDLGNLNGGLPFSVVFDRTGRVAHRKTGQLSPSDLAEWSRTV